MHAFNEKCDAIMLFLNTKHKISWAIFEAKTGLKKNDAILFFLKNYKGFLYFDNDRIELTREGKDFIDKDSFVNQRDHLPL